MHPAAARLLDVVSGGRITVVTDTGSVQKLQVQERAGGDGSPRLTDGVFRIAEFGFTSSPPVGSEVVLVRLWGGRTLCLSVATNHQPSRLKNLQPGDSALYDQRGAYDWLTPTGRVADGAGLPSKTRNVGTHTLEGSGVVTGNLTVCNGATGSFTTPGGQTVTVQDGLITNIF